MAMSFTQLQVLNCLPNNPTTEITAHETALACADAPVVHSIKNFDVIGSLKLDNKTIIRRLSVDSCVNSLPDWKENATIHFDRFLRNKQFYLSYTDVEGHPWTIDSDEKLEAALRLHRQKLSDLQNSSLPAFELNLEITDESPIAAPVELFETSVRQDRDNDKELATCDCVGCGKTVTMGLAYKCLHCNNVYICDDCKGTNENHSLHLLMPCLVLILGSEYNCNRQAGVPVQLVEETSGNGK
ncbi:uncharacterized protein LOC130700696 [Daphnia carinata]|uniref:uncharacterized protein LOC130700696 n=1 Tax=Daphnia carinata TaxID=120202 RepID=UPI00257BBF50|nr:uncharacterized protein LOC130700696 [Daphnia carinata]